MESIFWLEIEKGLVILEHIIGQVVEVTMDRPMGSFHPVYKDHYYPINYGYVEGMMAGDNEEQDAYVIGVDKPLKKFTGVVIAVIHRFNDNEDKWVVAPEGCTYAKEEIIALTDFQERYYQSEVRMES